MSLLRFTEYGLYCESGDFFIDPHKPVANAVVTHAHSDHAVPGCKKYLAHPFTIAAMQCRFGTKINAQVAAYGEKITHRGVQLSLHPAGHCIGSAQVRIEYKGEVWVVTGDYKTQADGSCEAFEPVICNTLVTECTFGVPFFNWKTEEQLNTEVHAWWLQNSGKGIISVLYAYSFGKAQRMIQSLQQEIGPVYCDTNTQKMNDTLVEAGCNLKATIKLKYNNVGAIPRNAFVLMPPGMKNDFALQRMGNVQTAMASGWMMMKKNFYRSVNKGFAISDHADFAGLCMAVTESRATHVYAVHGYVSEFAAHLASIGLKAYAVKSHKKILEAGIDLSEGTQLKMFE